MADDEPSPPRRKMKPAAPGVPTVEASVLGALPPEVRNIAREEAELNRTPGAALRHSMAVDRHIQDACDLRDRMAVDLAVANERHVLEIVALRSEFTLEIARQREKLEWLEPEYEGLRRDYDNLRSVSFPALAFITAGSVLIGVASFATTDPAKYALLAGGGVATACGLLLQGLIAYRSPKSKGRPRSELRS